MAAAHHGSISRLSAERVSQNQERYHPGGREHPSRPPNFEDEALQDETEPEETQEEHQSTSVYEQAQRYRAAKSVLQDVYALDEEHAEAVRELEQLWAEGYTVAAHQLGKFYRDDLSTMRDHEKPSGGFDCPRSRKRLLRIRPLETAPFPEAHSGGNATAG